MNHERVFLVENRKDAFIDVYTREGLYGKKRPAMLVIPGGGYGGVCSDREGEPIALLYLAQGFNCFVLHYPCAPNCVSEGGESLPLIVASMAVAHIRRNAQKYGIDSEKIAAVGFSAGGHLAASLANMWHYDFVAKEAGLEYGENKINAVILSYAVIASDSKISHAGSFNNLLTGNGLVPTEERLEFYSIEKQVSEKTPPTFIWHTFEDSCVPVMNAVVMAQALADKKIPCELHIFPWGGHGLSTCRYDVSPNASDKTRHAEQWIEASVRWLKITLNYEI